MRKSVLLTYALTILGTSLPAPADFRYWNPADTATVPKTLSATGLYRNIAAMPIGKKTLDTNAFHYDVNTPLWSDNAHKLRWVMLKNRNRAEGAGSIRYEERNDYWSYPESTVFIKQFAIDTNGLDTASRLLWETRILVNKKDTLDPETITDHWYGYSYKWRRNQQDADLIDMIHGKDDSLRVWPEGMGAGKVPVQKKWHFPSIYECVRCHVTGLADTVHGRAVLGFFTAQLNRPHPENPSINQLDYFFTKKILTGTKSTWDAATTPHWRALDDSAASVDVRARSYIAANCSGCHGRRGLALGATGGAELNYDFFEMKARIEFRYHLVGWSYNLDTLPPFFYKPNDPANSTHGDSVPINPALVVPGYPEKSVLLFRQTVRNTDPATFDTPRNQMPPLASFEVNAPAIALLTRWIKEMQPLYGVDSQGNVIIPPPGLVRGPSAHRVPHGPILRGDLVILPAESVPKEGASVKLTGIDGRTTELRATGGNAYALPKGLPKGIYIIRVGRQSFTRSLF